MTLPLNNTSIPTVQPAVDEPLLRLARVSRVYATEDAETYALRDVDLSINPGEFIAIAGPSGCGKSTLLSILGLLDTPSHGTYALEGRHVSGLSTVERAHIRNQHVGFIFQAFNLIGDLSVYENVELPLRYRQISESEKRARINSALERVGMDHRLKYYPSQLSGGQQQRVAVARAVVGDPLIILADEPTGNLDTENGEQVMGLLSELHSAGATLCMVTHDPRYATYADRTVAMLDGRVV